MGGRWLGSSAPVRQTLVARGAAGKLLLEVPVVLGRIGAGQNVGAATARLAPSRLEHRWRNCFSGPYLRCERRKEVGQRGVVMRGQADASPRLRRHGVAREVWMAIVLWELMAEPQGWSAMFVPGGAAARRRPGRPWRCESRRQRSPGRPETGERWSANPIDRTDFLLITPSATPRLCAHVVVSQRRPRARTPARHRVLCLARDPPRPPPPPPRLSPPLQPAPLLQPRRHGVRNASAAPAHRCDSSMLPLPAA